MDDRVVSTYRCRKSEHPEKPNPMNTNHGPRRSIGTKDTDGHTASLMKTSGKNYGTDGAYVEFVLISVVLKNVT